MEANSSLKKVFVSHAFKDKPFVDVFVQQILRLGANLREDDIFYTSAPGMGINSSQYLMPKVRDEIKRAGLVVAIITPMYRQSPTCMAELGAGWALDSLFPLMAPGMKRDSLDGILPGMFIESVDEESDILQMIDKIRDLGYGVSTSNINDAVKKWKSEVGNLSRHLSSPDEPDNNLETLQTENEQLKNDLSRVRLNLSEAERKLSDLVNSNSSSNDSGSLLKKIGCEASLLQHPKEQECSPDEREFAEFKKIMKEFHEEMRKLRAPRVTQNAVWCDYVGEYWYYAAPTKYRTGAVDDPDDLRNEISNGRLRMDDDESAITVNAANSDIQSIKEQIKKLDRYLRENNNSRLSEWFVNTYQSPMSVQNREFWLYFMDVQP